MLIDKLYLQTLFEISEITNVRIDEKIQLAQEIDIKALLGKVFYDDFILDVSLAKNQEILNRGLKLSLAYYSFARIVDSPNDIAVTRYGVVRKKTELSEPLQVAELARASAQLKQYGLYYANEAIGYIRENKQNYPLFERCEISNNSTAFTKIVTIKPKRMQFKP